jgi:hypothetical protein
MSSFLAFFSLASQKRSTAITMMKLCAAAILVAMAAPVGTHAFAPSTVLCCKSFALNIGRDPKNNF